MTGEANEANKEIVRRFVERFWGDGDLTAIGTLMATDAIIHQPEVGGTDGLKQFNRAMRAAFPDWLSTPEELVAEGGTLWLSGGRDGARIAASSRASHRPAARWWCQG